MVRDLVADLEEVLGDPMEDEDLEDDGAFVDPDY